MKSLVSFGVSSSLRSRWRLERLSRGDFDPDLDRDSLCLRLCLRCFLVESSLRLLEPDLSRLRDL